MKVQGRGQWERESKFKNQVLERAKWWQVWSWGAYSSDPNPQLQTFKLLHSVTTNLVLLLAIFPSSKSVKERSSCYCDLEVVSTSELYSIVNAALLATIYWVVECHTAGQRLVNKCPTGFQLVGSSELINWHTSLGFQVLIQTDPAWHQDFVRNDITGSWNSF